METRHLKIGVVQVDSEVGNVSANLEHAGELVNAAARQGAQIVLTPELMPCGYTLTEAIWNYAEPFAGRTVAWLTRLAKQLNIFLGTSFLEADGEDFYNTFALAVPDGSIAGRVRKNPPASLEAFFYRGGNDPHVIETALGRIGVGVCYENLLYEHLREMQQASVDLILQPMAAGRLKPMRDGDIELFDSMIQRCAPYHARTLGVPVAFADRTGPISTELPGGFGEFHSTFPGYSQIVDSDGAVKARMKAEEGVIVAEVVLDPKRKRSKRPRCYGGMWAFPMPWFAHIWPETQQMGEKDYMENPRRRQAALTVAK
ncbi:MAG TPA: carbon-nitrogen hydrolase family protein [Anaerolineales bacterium]|nr:carbon-nitrogen hydrolase family protein [Anaerolineales bacterium]